MTRDPSEYNVRAVERALQILECFDNSHQTRGVSEIAEAVGLHKATTHRLMTTLCNHGYLERLPGGQEYRLGMQLATLGLAIIRRLDVRREAVPYMAEVVERCGESCDLSVFDRGTALVIEVIKSSYALAMATTAGQRIPIHATAGGKLFLAFLPDDERETLLSRPLERYTARTIIDVGELRRQAGLFRRQGYSFDDEEYDVGVRAVSAPILNSGGGLIAVISMPGPAARITDDRLPEVIAAMTECAQAISLRMGWRPGSS